MCVCVCVSPFLPTIAMIDPRMSQSCLLLAGEDELPSEPYVLYMSTLSEDGVMAVKQTG